MTESMIPTPYGLLVDVNTGEPIGPADREQHAARSVPGAPLLTLADGRQADVVGGPELFDCGHSDADHSEMWATGLRFSVGAISWLLVSQGTPGTIDLDPDIEKGLCEQWNRTALVSVVTALCADRKLSAMDIMTAAIEAGSVSAGVCLAYATGYAVGASPTMDMFPTLVRALSRDDLVSVIEIGAAVAYNMDLTPEQLAAYAVPGEVGDVDG